MRTVSMRWIFICVYCWLPSLAVAQSGTPFQLPPFETLGLPNGLRIFLMPQKEVPLLHVTVALRTGSVEDPVKLNGLTALTTEALGLGSKIYTKNKIEETFDFHGAALTTSTDRDSTQIDLSLASKDLATLLPILADMIVHPTFPDQEVTKLKERSISWIKAAKESPNQVANDYFNILHYGDHPYARPTEGTVASIERIRRQDFLRQYQRVFQPQVAAIIFVGDFERDTTLKQIEALFGHWKKGDRDPKGPNVPALAPPRQGGHRVLLVDKPDATETTFRIGGRGVALNEARWNQLQVLNTVLGGRFTSWLNEELRIKTGLTYGARSRFEGFLIGGTFALASFTAGENSARALDLAMETYRRFLKADLDQKTLDSAKAYIKGQFPPSLETLGDLSSWLTTMWIYNLTVSSINQFEAQVDALTLASAQELIRTRFPSEGLDILLIGQAKSLRELAKKFGTVIETDMNAIDTFQVPR